jgi:hypothetical protein
LQLGALIFKASVRSSCRVVSLSILIVVSFLFLVLEMSAFEAMMAQRVVRATNGSRRGSEVHVTRVTEQFGEAANLSTTFGRLQSAGAKGFIQAGVDKIVAADVSPQTVVMSVLEGAASMVPLDGDGVMRAPLWFFWTVTVPAQGRAPEAGKDIGLELRGIFENLASTPESDIAKGEFTQGEELTITCPAFFIAVRPGGPVEAVLEGMFPDVIEEVVKRPRLGSSSASATAGASSPLSSPSLPIRPAANNPTNLATAPAKCVVDLDGTKRDLGGDSAGGQKRLKKLTFGIRVLPAAKHAVVGITTGFELRAEDLRMRLFKFASPFQPIPAEEKHFESTGLLSTVMQHSEIFSNPEKFEEAVAGNWPEVGGGIELRDFHPGGRETLAPKAKDVQASATFRFNLTVAVHGVEKFFQIVGDNSYEGCLQPISDYILGAPNPMFRVADTWLYYLVNAAFAEMFYCIRTEARPWPKPPLLGTTAVREFLVLRAADLIVLLGKASSTDHAAMYDFFQAHTLARLLYLEDGAAAKGGKAATGVTPSQVAKKAAGGGGGGATVAKATAGGGGGGATVAKATAGGGGVVATGGQGAGGAPTRDICGLHLQFLFQLGVACKYGAGCTKQHIRGVKSLRAGHLTARIETSVMGHQLRKSLTDFIAANGGLFKP